MFALLCLLLIAPYVYAEVDIGEEIRLRVIEVDGTEYDVSRGTGPTRTGDFFIEQRSRVHMEGKLANGVSIMTKIKSAGTWGSAMSLAFENAYLNFKRTENLPAGMELNLAIGRMGMDYGDGILLRDYDFSTGFNAIKTNVLFANDVNLDVFAIQVSSLTDTVGTVVRIPWQKDNKMNQQIYGLFQGERLTRNFFFGTRFWGEPQKDFSYKLEAVKDLLNPELALIAGIKAKERRGRYNVVFDFVYGSPNFYSSTAYVNKSDYGEYYIYHRKEIADANYSIKNLVIFKAGICYTAIKDFEVGVNSFKYNASQVGAVNFSPLYYLTDQTGVTKVGWEYDAFVKYKYSSNAWFKLAYTNFIPNLASMGAGTTLSDDDSARRIMLEFLVKF